MRLHAFPCLAAHRAPVSGAQLNHHSVQSSYHGSFMDMHLSPYGAASTRPSPVNRMMAAFTSTFRDGVDINLGVGFVNEQTIPVALLDGAMRAVAADGIRYRQAFNYGGPVGAGNLIAAIRRFLLRSRLGQLDAVTLDRNRLIVGPCGEERLEDT